MVWRIGNGNSVRIKQDQWLPNQPSRTPISAIPDLPLDATVSSLINQENGEWKTEVIQANFLLHEAEAILSIPLSERAPPDRITWSLTHLANSLQATHTKCWLHILQVSVQAALTQAQPGSFWRGIW